MVLEKRVKFLPRLTCLVLIFVFVGCTLFEAQETRFLRSAYNRGTQEEVQRRLGSPTLAKTALQVSLFGYIRFMTGNPEIIALPRQALGVMSTV
jgi:hypothetical protein